MHRRFVVLFPFLAGSLVLATAAASDWPRFRGPNGSGTAADRDVPVKWSAADGVLWKSPLPGTGNSSPIVTANRVFLQSASADGSERSLICLDAGSGKLIWTRVLPGHRARMHPKNTLASGTPASDGERVYIASWDGKDLALLAYSFAGELVWQRDLGPFTGQHGAGHSPIVEAGRVFLADDQDGSAVVLAFDAPTGKPLWRAERTAYRACYSTPFVRSTANGSELVVASTAGVAAYDPESGAVIWQCAWPFARRPLRTVASPVAGAGLVFANAGDGDGSRDMIAVRPGNKSDGAKGEVVWQESKSFPYVPTLLPQGDYLFSVSDAGIAACHQAATGKRIWSERLGSTVSASPILVGDKIYAAGEDGQIYVLSAGSTYKLLAKNTLGEPVMATPAVVDGRLYVRGKEHLFCIGKTSVR
jgi:outer membrane protein assembly factor BamB